MMVPTTEPREIVPLQDQLTECEELSEKVNDLVIAIRCWLAPDEAMVGRSTEKGTGPGAQLQRVQEILGDSIGSLSVILNRLNGQEAATVLTAVKTNRAV
jgi:hypothetical protein